MSLTAAILKWMTITDKRAMIVVGKEGFIDWAWSSEPLLKSGVFYRARQTVVELPAASLAAQEVDWDTLTVHVPFRIVKRGGRKEMKLPDGTPNHRKMDNTLVKALARAFRWKRMLNSGDFATIDELAAREGIAPSYMTRVMRLTLLAPAIVEAIVDGRQEPNLSLAGLMQPFPPEWARQ